MLESKKFKLDIKKKLLIGTCILLFSTQKWKLGFLFGFFFSFFATCARMSGYRGTLACNTRLALWRIRHQWRACITVGLLALVQYWLFAWTLITCSAIRFNMFVYFFVFKILFYNFWCFLRELNKSFIRFLSRSDFDRGIVCDFFLDSPFKIKEASLIEDINFWKDIKLFTHQ